MNRRMVFYMLGRIIMLEAALMMPPFICGLLYHEQSAFAFLITAAVALLFGLALTFFNKPLDRTIFAREGFAIVALAWISFSAIGALPFVISGEIPSYTNAFFETASGLSTTGASIVENVEAMSHAILFWRSFTHWIGGMGVLVLIMAIVPTDTGRSIHIMRAEMPGPIVGKLVPKVTSTAKILYLIYIALTSIEIILLLCGGMSLFESLVFSLGTAGTGGFSIYSDGLAGCNPYSQWVITVFMLLFGINFNLYYLLLMRKAHSIFKSEELWTYLGIVAVSVGAITYNIYPIVGNLSDSLRQSAFQVASIISTTGYATTDFNLWPTLPKTILFILMFTGACAGSTAGGFKLSRVILLFKQIRANLRHMLHSRSVESLRFEGKKVDNSTVVNVTTYLALYFLCLTAIFLLISVFDSFDLETNISAAASCFNNIGPGFSLIGPMSNYSCYSDISTWVLSFAMLLGRLEILPIILLFAPSAWAKDRIRIKRKGIINVK